MAEGGKETGKRGKLKVIDGGAKLQRVIEVESIGEYKQDHPSNKREDTVDPTKIIDIHDKK